MQKKIWEIPNTIVDSAYIKGDETPFNQKGVSSCLKTMRRALQ